MNKILESTKFVVDHSHHVKINLEEVDKFCKYFDHIHIKHWFNESPFNINNLKPEDRLQFLFVVHSICFSFWGEPKWKIIYDGEELDGAYGMIATIGRAIENKFPVLNAKYLSDISESDFSKILEGNIQIPLFEERINIIRDVWTILSEKFNGDFKNLLLEADGDSQKLLYLIIENFPSFRDESIYKGKRVYFYKRAQVLVSDIYQLFNWHESGGLGNIDELTACADYKLPFVFRRLGILSYSDDLADKVDNQIQIEKDSEEEIEIRANAIWVCELMKQKVKEKIAHTNSIYINDNIRTLWQKKIENDKPYHHTRTIFY